MKRKQPKVLLAIETSCDETALAVVRKKNERSIEVLADAVASQVDIHRATGGVVPEVAAREHVSVLRPLLHQVMQQSGVDVQDLNAIAVTIGPGLPPALAVGVTAARTLAYAWKKPVVPVHHIEGHIYSALLAGGSNAQNQKSKPVKVPWGPTGPYTGFQIPKPEKVFPALALIVSGGHTMLIHMTDHLQYEVIGSTRDDAAGEAFDKVARLLGLPYPGGPALSKLAQQGNPTAYDFPRPMVKDKSLDFSFAGLKTAVYYTLRQLSQQQAAAVKADLAASFEQAVIDTLVGKVAAALGRVPVRIVLLAGGVAANHKLRSELNKLASSRQVPLHSAPISLCGDNAIMIGLAGTFAYTASRLHPWNQLDFHARLDLTALARAQY